MVRDQPLMTDALRLELAHQALEGLSVGDAFGEQCFPLRRTLVQSLVSDRFLSPPWPWTDDTAMALSVVTTLRRRQCIDQDLLVRLLARAYTQEPFRGYGNMAHQLLSQFALEPEHWRALVKKPFGGQGSMGNGSAMRVAPVGAYFADDIPRVIEQARLSAQVTHAHPEGEAGAVAMAVATAYLWQTRDLPAETVRPGLFATVLEATPLGEVRSGIFQASQLPGDLSVPEVAFRLGNGSRVTCPDTVPFCVWILGHYMDHWEAALKMTASALGDIDTNCAIVGGALVMRSGVDRLPPRWRASREPLPGLE